MIHQDYSPAFEIEHLCDDCMELVRSPLCPFCLTEEITAWLSLYPDLKKTVMPRIKSYLAHISNRITTYGTTCIKCKEKRASVCSNCFSEFIEKELTKINTPSFVMQEYREFFNVPHPEKEIQYYFE